MDLRKQLVACILIELVVGFALGKWTSATSKNVYSVVYNIYIKYNPCGSQTDFSSNTVL